VSGRGLLQAAELGGRGVSLQATEWGGRSLVCKLGYLEPENEAE